MHQRRHLPHHDDSCVYDVRVCDLGSEADSACLLWQVCIIDMAESISIARALALKNKYTLAPTQVCVCRSPEG